VSRLAWKERVQRSRVLARAFALAATTSARWRRATGRRFAALVRLVHAWKHLGDAGLGARRVALVRRWIDADTREAGGLAPIARNRLRLEFVRSAGARALRAKFAAFPPDDRVRLRYPREVDDPGRQGDVMVLKTPDVASDGTVREKGVLLVMYHEAIEAFAACFDLPALAARWQLVLETSTWGTREWRLLPYLGRDLDVVVMAPREEDFAFLAAWGTNLVPLRVGSADWVDPAVFQAKPAGEPYAHDVIMVASWDPLKRHATLLDALASARASGRRLDALLVGVPAVWTRADIEAAVAARGLTDQVTILEKIAHAEVARWTARSRCAVLLSKQEGSSRILGESLLCGTPVVVTAGQVGIDRAHVNAQTGAFATDDALPYVLVDVVDHRDRYDPAAYARATIGYANATRKLNDACRALAVARGLAWTRDAVAKRNAPNLRYVDAGVAVGLEAAFASLREALLPVDL
jgi:glycosyltransferase involved in cell wall biosynthesis